MTDPVPITATRSRLALHLLAPEDVERVYAAALDRLARVGVAPTSAEVREALMAAGATDAGAGALGLPAQVVEAAAARAPKRVVLGARAVAHDVVLEPGSCLLGAGGRPASKAQPLAGGRPRPATLADVEDACRLADALPDVSVVLGPPLFTAVAGNDAARVLEIDRALRATTKHLQLTGVASPASASVAGDMARAVRGDEIEMRRRPPLSLVGGAETFAAAAVFARRGLPVGTLVAPLVAAPLTAPTPADLTEALVGFVAGVLAANTAIQSLAPGSAFVAPVWPALAGLPAADASAAAFIAAATQVFSRAGLPAVAGAFATGASAPDWQACSEGSFAALSSVTSGAALTSGAGTLCGGTVFSSQQLVADAEIFSWCATVAAGIDVDEETLAVEAIKQVDICGNFLGQRHTRRHMKDVWKPRLLDRTPWDAWVAGGRQGASEKAIELAGALLAEHEVESLHAEPAAKLEQIIATAGL